MTGFFLGTAWDLGYSSDCHSHQGALAATEPAMPVQVSCPNPKCGKLYSVAEEALGRSTRCKHCGQRFTLALSSIDDSDIRANGPKARSTSRSSEIPERMGRFAIRARLGAGAFGCVYRAYDTH